MAESPTSSCCGHKNKAAPFYKRFDWLLWGSLVAVSFLYVWHWLLSDDMAAYPFLRESASAAFSLINTVWWGVLMGVVMLALLSKIPRNFVMSILGNDGGLKGILRATLAGVLLDLCSHGILMVSTKLYERGASNGQVIAFLVASPWNSFSLTLVLFALIGIWWTLLFIGLSLVIAIISGLIFEYLGKRGTLPKNPNSIDIPTDFHFWREAKKGLLETEYSLSLFVEMLVTGAKDSKMVLRWLLFGVLLAAIVRASVDMDMFSTYFGPTIGGLLITVFAATIIEVCSEGSTPIAADLLTRAHAPGNSFAFLMTGVSTDYTEVMVLRDTTKSWKIPLFLPLVTVPQVLFVSWLINYFSV
jgi:hypothetical protein